MSSTNQHIKFQSETDVMKYYKENPSNNQVVIFEGVVYDVKEFTNTHPGGSNYLQENFGKAIDEIFQEYEHSITARGILKNLPQVGVCLDQVSTDETQSSESDEKEKNNKFSFDYDKPLVAQILQKEWTFDDYIKFINDPKVMINPVKDLILFDNIFLEQGSRASWQSIPICWTFHAVYWCMQIQTDFKMSCVWMVFAVFAWSFMEYVVHRFILHGEEVWLNKLPWSRYTWTFHFLLNGIHHAYPQDRLRVVLPHIPGIIIIYIFAATPFLLFLPKLAIAPFMVSYIVSYIIYEMIHYHTHHGQSKKGDFLNNIKLWHLQHHFKNGAVGFGISSQLWDFVFNTKLNDFDQIKIKKL